MMKYLHFKSRADVFIFSFIIFLTISVSSISLHLALYNKDSFVDGLLTEGHSLIIEIIVLVILYEKLKKLDERRGKLTEEQIKAFEKKAEVLSDQMASLAMLSHKITETAKAGFNQGETQSEPHKK